MAVSQVPERDCARRVSRRKLARSEDARTVLNRSTVRTLLRLVGDTAAVRWLQSVLLLDRE
jgi:hypothetical protein